MIYEEKYQLIQKILSSVLIVNNQYGYFVIKSPSKLLRYQAELYAQECFNKYKYSGLLRKTDVYKILIQRKMIDPDFKDKISNMHKSLDNIKLELYESGSIKSKESKVRKRLGLMKKRLFSYATRIDSIEQISLESFVENLKFRFILQRSIYNIDDDPIDSLSYRSLESIINISNSQQVSVKQYRELARTDPWRTYWNIGSSDSFGVSSGEMSEEQRTLSMFSSMYDNIYQNSECPDDGIVSDDDKLDGWMIKQKRDADSDKNEKSLDERFGTKPNQEIFVSVKDQEEANQVYDSNTHEAKQILKQRAGLLKANKEVRQVDFQDQKLKLQQIAQQQYVANVKRK